MKKKLRLIYWILLAIPSTTLLFTSWCNRIHFISDFMLNWCFLQILLTPLCFVVYYLLDSKSEKDTSV